MGWEGNLQRTQHLSEKGVGQYFTTLIPIRHKLTSKIREKNKKNAI
jgi:hypothetical protein